MSSHRKNGMGSTVVIRAARAFLAVLTLAVPQLCVTIPRFSVIQRSLSVSALLFVLTALGSGSAVAQGAESPESLAAANQLFSILSKDILSQMTEQVMAQAWPSIERDLIGRKVDAATIAALRAEFARIKMKNMVDVMKDAPAIYARHFTAAELRELSTFY